MKFLIGCIYVLLVFHLVGCVTINKPIYIIVENSPVTLVGVDYDLSGIERDCKDR